MKTFLKKWSALIVIGMLLMFCAIIWMHPNKRATPLLLESAPGLDLRVISDNFIRTLSDPGGLAVGKRSTLGQRLLAYDQALMQKKLAEVYSFRSKEWQSDVTLEKWTASFEGHRDIESVLVLAVEPVISKSKPAPAFQIVKMAITRDKTQTRNYVFFIENWIFQENEWVAAGGAPWDAPSLPIIGLL